MMNTEKDCELKEVSNRNEALQFMAGEYRVEVDPSGSMFSILYDSPSVITIKKMLLWRQ